MTTRTTCKKCRRVFPSLQEAMQRVCISGDCTLISKKARGEEPVAAKINTDLIIPAGNRPRQVKQRVLFQEVEPASVYDDSEKALFVEVPKAIVIKIYPKGK